MPSASFLANQKAMQTRQGHNNASSLFGLQHIPSDNQIRNLLDLLEAKLLFRVFAKVVSALEESGELEAFCSYRKQLLIILGGTQYFSSEEIQCENCSHHTKGEQTTYFHALITPVIAAPGNSRVMLVTGSDGVPK